MKDHELVEDYTRAPVPAARTLSGWQIMLVILTLGFTLPVFALGAEIAQAQGLVRGALACVLACVMSGLVAVGPSLIGARVRLSTYMILTVVFGPTGGRLINFMLAVILIGWFANVADLLGTAVSSALQAQYGLRASPFACTAVGLVAMTLTGIFGFRTMERFSMVTVPVLCIFMGGVVWLAIGRVGLAAALSLRGSGALPMVDAISAVVGLVVMMAVLAPDFTRYARNDRAALVSVGGLAFGYPCIMMMGAIPAALLGQGDIMKIMAMLGVSGMALVVLVISTWASNTGNIYSATLTLATLLPRAAVWQLGLGVALVALLAAWFHVSSVFVPFLEILGVATTPIAAVCTCCYFIAGRRGQTDLQRLAAGDIRSSLAAWATGAAVGYISQRAGGLLVPMPPFEGFVAALIAWTALHRLHPRTARGRARPVR